jgi:hypothetical protein
MIKVQISLDGPREIEVPLPQDWESWGNQGREAYIRTLETMLIESTVAFTVDDGQGGDL